MKKIFTVLMVIGLVLALTVPAQAQAAAAPAKAATCAPCDDPMKGPMEKLGRGFMNILDALCEIPGTMMRETKASDLGTGLTKGLALGVVNTGVRAVVGAFEVATFPFPIPEGYGQVLDEPKFLNE